MVYQKIVIGIVTLNRQESLAMTLSALTSLPPHMLYICHGDAELTNPLLIQVIGVLKQLNWVIILLHNSQKTKIKGIKLIYDKVECMSAIKKILFMDDDMILTVSNYEKLRKFHRLNYNVLQAMHPNGDPTRTSNEFIDTHIRVVSKSYNSVVHNNFAGGCYLLNLDTTTLNFDFKIEDDNPFEDRKMFDGVQDIYILTNCNAFHLTSKEIGSHYNYKKYFGEENKYWKDG